MKYYGNNIDNIQKLLNTDFACGLSEREVKKRLSHYGKNIIFDVKKNDASKITVKLLYDPVTLLLILCSIICFTTSLVKQAILILVVLFVNLLITVIAYYKSENILFSMKSYGIPKMKVLRDKKIFLIDSRMLVPGDILLIEKGDIICTDCKLLSGQDLMIYEKDVTGNDNPKSKNASDENEDDILYASSSVIAGHGVAVVLACSHNTRIVSSSGLIPLYGKHYPDLFHKVKKRCRIWGLVTSFISIILFTVNLFTLTYDIFDAFLLIISLMGASMAETLFPLTHISTSKEISLAAMSGNKNRVIIKNSGCIEKLRDISVFVLTDEITNFENMNFITSLIEKKTKAIICADSNNALSIATRYGASVCNNISEIEYAKGSLAVFVSNRVDDTIRLIENLKEREETVGVLTTKLSCLRLLTVADVSFTYGKFQYKTGEISKIKIDTSREQNNQILSRLSDVICEENMASTYRAVECSKKIYSVVSHSAAFLITMQLVRTALCILTIFGQLNFVNFTQILCGGMLFDLLGVLFLSFIRSDAFSRNNSEYTHFTRYAKYSLSLFVPCIFFSFIYTLFNQSENAVSSITFLCLQLFLPVFLFFIVKADKKHVAVLPSLGYLLTLILIIFVSTMISGLNTILGIQIHPVTLLFCILSTLFTYLFLYFFEVVNRCKLIHEVKK